MNEWVCDNCYNCHREVECFTDVNVIGRVCVLCNGNIGTKHIVNFDRWLASLKSALPEREHQSRQQLGISAMIKVVEWNINHTYQPISLLTEELYKNFDALQIVQILDVIDNICRYCWNSNKPCHCWNDE